MPDSSGDTEFDRKVAVALRLLETSGVSRWVYLPPIFLFYWRLGLKLPPPHFLSLRALLLVTGLPFGVSLLGWFMVWNDPRPPDPLAALLVLGLATLIFGSVGSRRYLRERRRLRLPRWADL